MCTLHAVIKKNNHWGSRQAQRLCSSRFNFWDHGLGSVQRLLKITSTKKIYDYRDKKQTGEHKAVFECGSV
jgi:hypothetical protein